MLEQLHVENLAIIEHLNIQFHPGLNVITGETGAGKSIIVNAIKLLMGERATKEMVRYGKESAVIEAFFTGKQEVWEKTLLEVGIEPAEELLVKRIINKEGKNRVFINGQLATLQMLQQVISPLLTLSGQHEYQHLLLPSYQLEILDAFAELEEEKKRWQRLYSQFLKALKDKEALSQRIKQQAERRELLLFEIQEIENARLSPHEEDELKEERRRLRHIGFLKELADKAYWQLYGEENAITSNLASLEREMEEAAGYDPRWKKWLENLRQALYQLEDLAHSLKDYGETLFFEPDHLEAIEARLAEISRLKKKYKVADVKELLALKEKFVQELEASENLEDQIREIERQSNRLKTELIELAQQIRAQREKKAKELQERLTSFLKTLGMKHVTCEIALRPLKSGLKLEENVWVNENGAEEVEFLFSANVGEPLRPLNKIASGGELARFLLGLKSILGIKAGTETIVFDEIDTGVGGDIGTLIGQKLKQLAQSHQVICITHLPQIACQADIHFKVEKQIKDQQTITTIYPLNPDERINEITRMLGGKFSSRPYAEALLKQAQ